MTAVVNRSKLGGVSQIQMDELSSIVRKCRQPGALEIKILQRRLYERQAADAGIAQIESFQRIVVTEQECQVGKTAKIQAYKRIKRAVYLCQLWISGQIQISRIGRIASQQVVITVKGFQIRVIVQLQTDQCIILAVNIRQIVEVTQVQGGDGIVGAVQILQIIKKTNALQRGDFLLPAVQKGGIVQFVVIQDTVVVLVELLTEHRPEIIIGKIGGADEDAGLSRKRKLKEHDQHKTGKQ